MICEKVTSMLFHLVTKMEPALTPSKQEMSEKFNFSSEMKKIKDSPIKTEEDDEIWNRELKAKVRAVGRMSKLF